MKMKPKVFTPEQMKAIKSESAVQTTETVIQKSADPEHFPVFDIPVNGKRLVYVPKHIEIDAESGEEVLRMDKPLIHMVIEGKRYKRIRCIRGLSEAAGYSGNCPICDGESEPWDLANEQIKEQCAQRGLDVNDSENEAVRAIKRECYSNRVIKAPDQYYTFPIVVIETEPDDLKKIVMGDDGIPKHKAYWYTISKSAYEKNWLKTLEGMEDEPTHPGGYFFILNYTYESKSGEYNKRDSARNLSVVHKGMKNSADLAALLDKETEDWDVIKAMSTVYDNMFYEESDLEEDADRILKGTREKLAIYQAAASMPAGAIGAGAGVGGFQLGKPEVPTESDDNVGGIPMVDSIDE